MKVWDPLVRIAYWTLVGAFCVAYLAGDELEALHESSGYVVLGVVAVRLVWGFVGTRHARFGDFVRRPSVVLPHLKDVVLLRARRYLGHNPAAGAMIVALLISVALTGLSGLAAREDGFAGELFEELHEGLANLTLILVGVHVTRVLASSLLDGENLIKAMINGRKRRRAQGDA